MDYDQTDMPAAYDAGRGHRPQVLDAWLKLIGHRLQRDSLSDIVDLGCGTGRYSEGLAAHFGARVIGVDPSDKMLAEARKKPASGRVSYQRAAGEALPLGDASADMVFISMVFHHFSDRDQVAREIRRVLRPGGALCLRGGTTEQIENYACAPFFPDSISVAWQVLPSRSAIESCLEGAGFRLAHHELVQSEVAENWSAYADKVALRADSILLMLPDSDFERGLGELRAFAAKTDAREPVVEPVDFFVWTAPSS